MTCRWEGDIWVTCQWGGDIIFLNLPATSSASAIFHLLPVRQYLSNLPVRLSAVSTVHVKNTNLMGYLPVFYKTWAREYKSLAYSLFGLLLALCFVLGLSKIWLWAHRAFQNLASRPSTFVICYKALCYRLPVELFLQQDWASKILITQESFNLYGFFIFSPIVTFWIADTIEKNYMADTPSYLRNIESIDEPQAAQQWWS